MSVGDSQRLKVLVSTRRGQGQRNSDFFESDEGELVFLTLEGDCNVDAECGCRRSLEGKKGRSTTFMVMESALSQDEYINLCRESMTYTGRFKPEELDPEFYKKGIASVGGDLLVADLLIENFLPTPEEEADLLLKVADQYSVGTVLERRHDEFLPRIVEPTAAERIRYLIEQGESKTVEFKETLSWDVRKQSKEAYVEVSALKTIVGFLNSDGGTLFIGVSDDGEIKGIETEILNLHSSKDRFLLHFKNLFKSKIGELYYPNINSQVMKIDGAELFIVECSKSDYPCYLDDRDFYVRTSPATDKLEGRKAHEYIARHFRTA